MAPLTSTSSTPAPSENRGPSESKARIVWYGGQNAHQDVCIRLVCDTISNDVDDGRSLARLMVHSSRLETCSSYFGARMSQRWTSQGKRSPQELIFHVNGDVRLYIDCFCRMYNPSMDRFKTVEHSLELLAVATHLAYDDLMSSICLYLASICSWSEDDEMRIWSSVLSEDFPRGHAQDLLERLETRLTRDDLRPLISSCIEVMKSSFLNGSSLGSAMEARDLLGHLLVTARGQKRSPIPTFAQEAVCVINEEFQLLLVTANVEIEAANVEIEATDIMEDNPGLVNTVYTIQQILDFLLRLGMADEAVKCFAQYSSFPKLIEDTARSEFYGDDDDVMLAVETMTWTVVSILSDLVSRNVDAEESARDALLHKWLPLLDWLYRNADEVLEWYKEEYCEEYRQVKEALVSIRPSSQELKEIIDQVLVP